MKKKKVIKGIKQNEKQVTCYNSSINKEFEDCGFIIDLKKYEPDGEQTLQDYEMANDSYFKHLTYEEATNEVVQWYEDYMQDKLRDFKFSVSLYPHPYKTKPNQEEIKEINSKIASNTGRYTLEDFKNLVGEKGCAFMGGIFVNIDKQSYFTRRIKSNFAFQQVWALDFDKNISFEEFINRATKYKILPHFVYKTMSCDEENINKFRAVWIADFVCTHTTIAESISKLLMTVFPESDPACKDVSRIFFGGKGVIYENDLEYLNRLDLLNLVKAVQQYIADTNQKHRLAMMREVSNNTKICLNGGLMDIQVKQITQVKEYQIKKGCLYFENSNFFSNINYDITSKSYSKLFDEEVPIEEGIVYFFIRKWTFESKDWYVLRVNLGETKIAERKDVVQHNKTRYKIKSNLEYSVCKNDFERGITKTDIEGRCKLCKKFFQDEYLTFDELFGICTNLIHIERGLTLFKEQIKDSQHNISRNTDWQTHSETVNKQALFPMRCDNFCPYKLTCKHGKNLIETVKTKRNRVVVIDKLELISLEKGQERLKEIIKGVFENE